MLWQSLTITSLLALAAAAGYCVWLLAERRALRADRDRVANDLAQREAAIEGYLDQVEQLQTALNEKQNQLTEQRAKLEGLGDNFKTLANDVLKQSSEQFLQLAKENFDGKQKDAAAQLEQRKQAIESLIKPIRESLDKHREAVAGIETKREGAYQGLRQQLTSMLEDQKILRGETANLVKALRRPEVRGRWGEMQLKRVAELAGMVENCDFTEQGTLDDGLRPDMRVRLPGGREIVVDAKTPIDAFLAAVEAQTDDDRDRELDRHVRHITDKISDLSSKRYQDQVRSADFVVLFIPGESFLYAAASRRQDLIEYAMTKGVVIATPTTLIALLKAVALGWREEKVAESAQKIKDLGCKLHDQIGVVLEKLAKHQKSLSGAFDSYNELLTAVEGRLVSRARNLADFGAGSSKVLPADPTPQIEIIPREVKQPVSE